MSVTLKKKPDKDGTISVNPCNDVDPTLVKQIAASRSHEWPLHLHGSPIEYQEKVVVPEEMASYAISPY